MTLQTSRELLKTIVFFVTKNNKKVVELCTQFSSNPNNSAKQVPQRPI